MANLTGFKSDNKGLYITKDSQANVVYGLDQTDWLPSGDGLSSAVVTIETISGDASPLALPTDASTDVTITGALVNIRLNGGSAGNIYNVDVTIVTSNSDTDVRRFRIAITDKHL